MSNGKITLYHYTDKASAEKTEESKVIYKSTNTMTDVIYGIGICFTDMDPSNYTTEQIAWNNLLQGLSPVIKTKLEYCIEVIFPTSHVQDCCKDGRRIFLYPGQNVNLSLYQHKVLRRNLLTVSC